MQVISRSQAGEGAAFATLFEQYKNLVYKTAYLMLGDATEAEDALLEVFVRVHKSLPTFDPSKGAFTTWLHRVTINFCLNHRRKRRLTCVPLEDVPLELHGELLTVDRAEQQAVRQAIGELSEKLRVVVILRYYSDLPYAEIARVLDIPLGTVKSRLDLGIRTLRRILEEE